MTFRPLARIIPVKFPSGKFVQATTRSLPAHPSVAEPPYLRQASSFAKRNSPKTGHVNHVKEDTSSSGRSDIRGSWPRYCLPAQPLIPTPSWRRASQIPHVDPIQLRSGISPYQVLTLAICSLAGGLIYSKFQEPSPLIDEVASLPTTMPSPQLLEGRPGNLTAEQEEKLRKMWDAVLQVCSTLDANDAPAAEGGTSQTEAETPKKKRFGMFRKNRGDSKSGTSTPVAADASGNNADEDDKYGQNKQFQEALSRLSPEEIRTTIWAMVKHDHPDALALRFLRARKWDVDRALVMMISTMNWRRNEMRVDADIMLEGEAGSLADSKGEGSKSKESGEDFMEQIRLGKSFLHNTDKNGRPICTVRVRLHKQGEQSEESLERYTVYIIETARMVLKPPVDTATIIFDMTGFSMANMDYAPVKFMIKCFEANFPESLGAVLVHNSPWLFQGIWKVIRGWLDPVVAGKVHFTSTAADLAEFIDADKISKELGGDEDWEYHYIEPVEGENNLMKDTAARDQIQAARDELVKQFEAVTIEWIKPTKSEEAQAIKAKRTDLAAQLRENYWKLDPYIRARSLYDRVGMVKGEKENWNQTPAPVASATTSAPPVQETSPDDLD